jgi:hypothetical protein
MIGVKTPASPQRLLAWQRESRAGSSILAYLDDLNREPVIRTWTYRLRQRDTSRSHVRDIKQQARQIFACLFKLFSMAVAERSRRHDHETTVDHTLIRGLVTAGPVIRRGASSV